MARQGDQQLHQQHHPQLEPYHHDSSGRAGTTSPGSATEMSTAATASTTPSAGPGGTTKTRRSHRKSRNGCTECKRRHIRCDEGRPSCTNCTIAERACSFPSGSSAAATAGANAATVASLEVPTQPGHHQQAHSPARSTSSGGSRGGGAFDDPPQQRLPSFNESFADAAPAPPPPPPPQQHRPIPPPSSTAAGAATAASSALPTLGPSFTPQHLQLLHHVETSMDSDILGVGQTPTVIDMTIRHAVEAPYLIDQLLAFSALHCAHQRPEHAATFRHIATELQTRGLNYFAKETERLGAGEAGYGAPHFLYATLLSLQTLAETLAYIRSDFELFMNSFIECVHLHRGILYIVRPQFQVLMQSELEPILSLTQIQLPKDPRRGNECDPLHGLINATPDLSPPHANALRESTRLLQWAFDLSARLPHSDIPHAVSSWIIMVPPEFVDVLQARRPEGLVLMAYYGALLHRTRRYWVLGGSGAFLINAVGRYLGDRWLGALQWPLGVLERERD